MPDDFFPNSTDWRKTLAVGDILLFRFPIFEPSDRSEARPRPCLVSDLTLSYGVQFVELVPGLDGVPDAPDGTEIAVDRAADGRGASPARPAAGATRGLPHAAPRAKAGT